MKADYAHKSEKRSRAVNTIPLHPVVVELFRSITDIGLLVFDWPFCNTNLYKEFHRIQKAAGIDLPCREDHERTDACHRYGFHDLKRARGTLNAAKLPVRVLNAFMRHRLMSTTEKYYIHKERLLDGHVNDMFVPSVLREVESC